MKIKFTKSVALVLSVMFFQVGMGVGSALAQDANSLKSLLTKKFDMNVDGALFGPEQTQAMNFLKGLDKNGDGAISAAEQAIAIDQLKKMPDPKKVVKPIPKPAPKRIMPKKPDPNGRTPQGGVVMKEGMVPKIRIGRPRTREKINEEAKKAMELQAARQKAMEERRKKLEEAVPKIQSGKKSFYDNSIIIVAAKDNIHCVVPKGAVLNLPGALGGGDLKIQEKPVGQFVLWPTFYKKYARWIKTREVSWATAKGEDPIKKEEKKMFADAGQLVVAVFKKNPVSVLEPPPEEEKAVEDNTVKGALGSDSKK